MRDQFKDRFRDVPRRFPANDPWYTRYIVEPWLSLGAVITILFFIWLPNWLFTPSKADVERVRKSIEELSRNTIQVTDSLDLVYKNKHIRNPAAYAKYEKCDTGINMSKKTDPEVSLKKSGVPQGETFIEEIEAETKCDSKLHRRKLREVPAEIDTELTNRDRQMRIVD